MMKKLIHVLLLLFFSGIICCLYHPPLRLTILVAGGCVAYIAIYLFPHRIIALCAAVFSIFCFSIYDLRTVWFIAPAVFAAGTFVDGSASDRTVPPKRDNVFCTVVLLSIASNVISVVHTLSKERFCLHSIARSDLFLFMTFVGIGGLLINAIRTKKNMPKRRGKEKSYYAKKLITALSAALCAAAVCTLYYSTQSADLWSFSWPVFMCGYVAVTYSYPYTAKQLYL